VSRNAGVAVCSPEQGADNHSACYVLTASLSVLQQAGFKITPVLVSKMQTGREIGVQISGNNGVRLPQSSFKFLAAGAFQDLFERLTCQEVMKHI